MCGIVGVYSSKGIDLTMAHQMTDALQHRGPDAGGYYNNESKSTFLGHRRLSIIDLSSVANQPMHSADGRYVMVYNGEVYNYNELRKKLPNQHWQTHSDTEVILELFANFGAQSFSWLNGMFALSIYDVVDNKIFIARDPIGIKPLYIVEQDGLLAWASELKALKHISKSVIKNIDYQSVAYFLHLGYIPEPLSIFQEIGKFPAGYWAEWNHNDGTKKLEKFWDINDYHLKNPITDETHAFSGYKERLYGAIERQLVSDVPIGTFLSGGIDSSLVTAVASKVNSGVINTFSIGFEDKSFDESVYAENVARHLKTAHHQFRVKSDDVLALIPSLIEVYDEPFSDSSAFPTMLVSELARKYVTVTLSGDGGDELFQGYGMYSWAQRLENPMVKILRKPLHQISKYMNQRYQRAGLLFDYPDKQRIPSHIFSQEQYYFSEQELGSLLLKPTKGFYDFNKQPFLGLAQEKQAAWDINHYLKDNLLVKVDRASMKYSLESRVPLLDLELVQYALNIPYHLKVKEGRGSKYLMKRALYELVPRDFFDRPKRGFGAPIGKWLKKELAWMMDDYLNDEILLAAGFVNIKNVKNIIHSFRGGKDFLYNRIWALIVLHKWWKEQV